MSHGQRKLIYWARLFKNIYDLHDGVQDYGGENRKKGGGGLHEQMTPASVKSECGIIRESLALDYQAGGWNDNLYNINHWQIAVERSKI